MALFIYDGKIYPAGTPVISADNRGLRYGDGLFETMKLKDGRIILGEEHFARLWKGLQSMQFDIPKLWSPEKFEASILELAKKNKLMRARIRLTMIRGSGGLYDAADNTPHFIIETAELPSGDGILNANGLELCIYKDAVKAVDSFSNLKHNNALPYLAGAGFAKKQKCNDALILNSRGNICEATIANVFSVKAGVVYTPALSEGCIAGVMRKKLITCMRETGFEVNEGVISINDILHADEIFLSNSVRNMRWVAALGEKRYACDLTQKIAGTLNEKYPEIFGA